MEYLSNGVRINGVKIYIVIVIVAMTTSLIFISSTFLSRDKSSTSLRKISISG